MIPADKKVERMLTVARMYYEQGKTQNEIASAIGVSRPLVSVLLTEARECGIVTITVNDIRVTAELLTERLRARFGVERVVIIPDEDIDDNTNKALAARAYAEIFSSENENARLGVGWGSMLDKMASYAESLADVKKGDGRIFPLVGGINSVIRSYHTNELVRILALKSGKRPAFLYIPALLDTNADLELTKRTEPYALIEKEWRAMEQAVVSLSNFRRPHPCVLFRREWPHHPAAGGDGPANSNRHSAPRTGHGALFRAGQARGRRRCAAPRHYQHGHAALRPRRARCRHAVRPRSKKTNFLG